jgi:hypothetical protein
MSSAPKHGDAVPPDLRAELIDLIEAEKVVIRGPVLAQAREYARVHLGMAIPTVFLLWNYVAGRLRAGASLCYANLDDYPDRWGYAMRDADGAGLYIKLRFDDRGHVVLMSFHG